MKVIEIIERHGYNRSQVAELMGTSKGNLSRSINTGPTSKMLHRIANAIGADYDEFFEDEVPASPPEFAGEIMMDGKRYGLVEITQDEVKS